MPREGGPARMGEAAFDRFRPLGVMELGAAKRKG